MATDANAIRAAQAGKTVTTSDGYQITYDENGFGRKSVAPDGSVKYYDSLGNQTKTEWTGPAVSPQQQSINDGIAAVKAQQDANNAGVVKDPAVVAQEQANADAIANIEANRNTQNTPQTPQEAVAAVSAEQAKIDAQNGVVKDPAVVAQEQANADAIANIEANRTKSSKAETPEDPFEAARLSAAAESDKPGPTEADVIAANEPTAKGQTAGTKTVSEEDNTPWVTDGGWQSIYALNKDIIKNPDLIYPGQVLKMPGGGTYTVAKGDNLTKIAAGNGAGKYSRTVTKKVPDESKKDTGISVDKKPKIVKNDFKQKPDWRVRLSLAPHATYLYKAAHSSTNILYPLLQTDGIIFPYTPQIQINYTANYDATDLTHSNYKHYQYKNSEVGAVQITAMFTAQDVKEANYLLAVIHFLRSATKMFYGQDNNPKAGTPPPLLYLNGYGAYQFDNHPLVLTSFNMSLPDDVDYIRAGTNGNYSADATSSGKVEKAAKSSLWDSIKARLSGSKLNKGGAKDQPVFNSLSNMEATYVPTKMQITLSCAPIVTRNDISNTFSLEKYATGELLRGSKRQTGGGGIW